MKTLKTILGLILVSLIAIIVGIVLSDAIKEFGLWFFFPLIIPVLFCVGLYLSGYKFNKDKTIWKKCKCGKKYYYSDNFCSCGRAVRFRSIWWDFKKFFYNYVLGY